MLHIFLSCKLPMKVAMSDSFSGANPIKIGMCAHVYLERITWRLNPILYPKLVLVLLLNLVAEAHLNDWQNYNIMDCQPECWM
jgi:FRG domain.